MFEFPKRLIYLTEDHKFFKLAKILENRGTSQDHSNEKI